MKFSAAILAAATAVSGATLRRQTNTYYVSDFSANCIPHSVECNYHFDVLAAAASSSSVTCDTLIPGPDELPDVPLTACSSPYYSFSVTHSNSTGLDLSITTPLSDSTNVTGTHHIDAADIITTQNGAVSDQSYTGATSFSVPGYVAYV